MSIGGKARGFLGSLLMVSFASVAFLPGCDEPAKPTAKSPPNDDKSRGCNGGAFVIKMKKSHPACPAADTLPTPDGGKGRWIVDAICGGGPDLPIELQGNCALTWDDGDGSSLGAPDAQRLQEVEGVESVDEDCVVSAPQGLADAAGEQMHQIFRKAAGVAFDASHLKGIPFRPSFAAVVDSLPPQKVPALFGDMAALPSAPQSGPGNTDPFPFGKEKHGWVVLSLIMDLTSYQIDLAAPEPTRLTKLDAGLALPNLDSDYIDMTNGGYSGRQFHLANAICDVVRDWKTWRSKQSNRNIAPPPVIAMPLGALPLDGQKCSSAAEIEASSLPTRITYHALLHAACHGAAIVAASGNDANGPEEVPKCDEPDGPLCPGAMSKINAPTPTDCDDMYAKGSRYSSSEYRIYNPPVPPPSNPIKNPLVHMISAVDPSGALLPTTRVASRSRLAAMGAQGIVKDRDGVWEAPRTGTSISAAVAAAAFATLFAYKPDLTAAEAANIIYNSALETNADPQNPTQVADDGSGDTVKMISICNALEQTLKLEGQLECDAKVNETASTIVVNGDLYAEIETPPLPVFLDVETSMVASKPSSIECSGDSPNNNPQPGSHKCTDCGYLFDSKQAVIRLEGGTEVALSQLTLILRDKDGIVESFLLKNFGFAPGSSLVLNNITSAITADRLRNVTFEAIVEGDDYSAAVSGDIPIYRRP